MNDRQPVDVTNLDRYGHPALEWSRAHDILSGPPQGPEVTFFLGTVSPDGRPHAAGIGAIWHDGDLYVVSGPGTRKSRNLAERPACTVSVSLEGIDLVFDGEAHRVTDAETLERVAAVYRDSGWPAEVQDGAFTAPYSAPSAGPPPWYLYRVTYSTVVAVAGAEPYGATRWTFEP